MLALTLTLPTILNERAASPRTRNILGISLLFALTEVRIRRFLLTFNMLLYDRVLLLMQNDDRVCLYNGVVVKAQCKLLETQSFGLRQRRSPVMWMQTNINMFLSVTRQKCSGRIA